MTQCSRRLVQGEELTSGLVDQKEGIYLGRQAYAEDARPLHGSNLWPTAAEEDWAPYPEAPLLRSSTGRYMQGAEHVRCPSPKKTHSFSVHTHTHTYCATHTRAHTPTVQHARTRAHIERGAWARWSA